MNVEQEKELKAVVDSIVPTEEQRKDLQDKIEVEIAYLRAEMQKSLGKDMTLLQMNQFLLEQLGRVRFLCHTALQTVSTLSNYLLEHEKRYHASLDSKEEI